MFREKVLKPAEVAQFVLTGFAVILLLMLLDGPAHAATPASIALTCTPPTTRADGTALSAAELGPYHWVWADAAATGPAVEFSTSTGCAVKFNVAVGTCVKAGSAFTVYATDLAGQMSPLANPVFTVGADVCTPKSLPGAPTAVKAVITPAS